MIMHCSLYRVSVCMLCVWQNACMTFLHSFGLWLVPNFGFLPCLLNCNMFLSLFVCFTHFARCMRTWEWAFIPGTTSSMYLVPATALLLFPDTQRLFMRWSCFAYTLDAHSISHLTCHTFSYAFSLVRHLASIPCLCVLVYTLLTLFLKFFVCFCTNLNLIKFVAIFCMVCACFHLVDVSSQENHCQEISQASMIQRELF